MHKLTIYQVSRFAGTDMVPDTKNPLMTLKYIDKQQSISLTWIVEKVKSTYNKCMYICIYLKYSTASVPLHSTGNSLSARLTAERNIHWFPCSKFLPPNGYWNQPICGNIGRGQLSSSLRPDSFLFGIHENVMVHNKRLTWGQSWLHLAISWQLVEVVLP